MEPSLSSRARILSLVEFVLGGFIVIGHNVLHILPNEVPILFVLGWISLRVRDGGWKAAGLTRPNSWWKTAVLAVGAAAVLQLGSELVVGPLASRIWPGPQHVSHALESAALGWRHALTSLLIIWTFAAFGEELSGPRRLAYPRRGHLRAIKGRLCHGRDPCCHALWLCPLL